MTVYVEIVIFNNLFIDLLLGITTTFCRRRKPRYVRLLLSSIIGTLVSVFYAFMPSVAQIVVRLLLAPILVAVMDKYVSFKDFFVSLMLFVAFTFALGGGVYGLSYLVGIDLRGYAVLGVLAMTIVIMELIIWFVVIKKPSNSKEYYDISIIYKGKIYWLKGFYDSGNTLTDSLTGRPVVLLSKSTVSMLQEESALNYDGFVDVKTVNGESSMPMIEFDEIRCGQSVYHGFGALTDIEMKNYDLIMQNTLTYK